MAKKSSSPHDKEKWSKKEIPPWGRKKSHVESDMGVTKTPPRDTTPRDTGPALLGGPEMFAADVPLNNTGPTVVRGTLEGGMPNWPRMARGRVISQKGKYGLNIMFPIS